MEHAQQIFIIDEVSVKSRVYTEGQNIKGQGKVSWRIRYLSPIVKTSRKQGIKCEPGEEGLIDRHRG